MAGHSHWHNIQQKKGKNDAKKGVIFTKMAQQIILAAREGGPNPDLNQNLRIAIDNAKSVNTPNVNIERAIQRGAGTGEGIQLHKILYEGYAPGSIPTLVMVITDSKNRTVNELRTLFAQNGGNLGEEGSVQWQFEESGLIEVKCVKTQPGEKFGEPDKEVIQNKEDVMLEIMDIEGILDIEDEHDDEEGYDILYVRVQMNQLAQCTNAIRKLGYVVLSSGPHYVPNNYVQIDPSKKESIEQFFEMLDDHPDVQKVWNAADFS